MLGSFGKHYPIYQVVLCAHFFLCNMKKGSPLLNHFEAQGKVNPLEVPSPLSNTLRNHCAGLKLCISILIGRYPHFEPYEWDYPCFLPPFDPVNLNWAQGQTIKVQALESIKDFFKHKDSSGLHFGHKWLTHFGCANGFSRLCLAFFGWGLISRCGAYWWFSSYGEHTSYFGHFVFMCHSSAFLFHSNNTSFFSFMFFLVGFNKKVM